MNEDSVTSDHDEEYGWGLASVLTVILVSIKAVGIGQYSWLFAFGPVLVVLAFEVAVVLVAAVVGLIAAFMDHSDD